MSTYDSKLAEWFKQVEKQEQELKAKKTVEPSSPGEDERFVEAESQVHSVEIGAPAVEAEPSVVASVDTQMVAADVELAERPAAVETFSQPDLRSVAEVTQPPVEPEAWVEAPVSEGHEAASGLFEDEELPQVEDFLKFLSRSAETTEPDAIDIEMTRRDSYGQSVDLAPSEVEETLEQEPAPAEEEFRLEPEVEVPASAVVEPAPDLGQPEAAVEVVESALDQGLLGLVEGTGEPRPVSELLKVQPAEPETAPLVEAAAPAPPEAEEPVLSTVEGPHPEPVEGSQPAVIAVAAQVVGEDGALQEKWDRMPHHLQTLFETAEGEVAQHSYKTFRESREELIQRLLDPVISLEEAARILNVCPTTVRRYTNRGVLRHIRTAGNQRRFRLSDVLTFMESNVRMRISDN